MFDESLPLWATLLRLSVVALGTGVCVLGLSLG